MHQSDTSGFNGYSPVPATSLLPSSFAVGQSLFPALSLLTCLVRYRITHTTTYTYDRPVTLSPHAVRLRPRSDVAQQLHHFLLDINPEPRQIVETIDLDGNAISQVWFPDTALDVLHIKAVSEVETYRTNPFAFLLEPWAVHLPIDYPTMLRNQLQPYLGSSFVGTAITVDPVATQLAQEIWQTHSDIVPFLGELNQRIYSGCQYEIRETGEPLPAGLTWTRKAGSCRDFAVLFIEACRAIGLAARFVSGYQGGVPDETIDESGTSLDSPDVETRHLHAWAEVYLPGAGWRGYDPTQGLAVADGHIALVASSYPRLTTPIAGLIKQGTGARSHLDFHLTIEPLH